MTPANEDGYRGRTGSHRGHQGNSEHDNHSTAFVFVCVACNLLFDAERRDRLTCSTACRVKAHRSGDLKRLRSIAKAWDTHPAGIQRGAAVDRLRPDLGDRIMRGELKQDNESCSEASIVRFSGSSSQPVTFRPKRYRSVRHECGHAALPARKGEAHRPPQVDRVLSGTQDKHPSLGIRELDDGTVLVSCHAEQCGAADIVHAVGLELHDLFPAKPIEGHVRKPERRPFLPSDVYEVVQREVAIIAVIASDMHRDREINDGDYQRLYKAVERLNSIAEVAYGR